MNAILKNKLVLVTLLAYALTLILSRDFFLLAIQNTTHYLREMLMVMPVIFMLTVLIEVWISREAILKHLGDSSGVKGVGFSVLLGSLSAGPIYAAFPICKMLLAKGASITNLVVILSAWAVIKVPMLANETKFLGVKFMVIRWILTVVTIYLMGIIISRFVKKEDIPETLTNNIVGLDINPDACIGCGVCAETYPQYFEMKDKKAYSLKSMKGDYIQDNQEVIGVCPTKAIAYGT